jgi:hypothetical protein
VSDIWGLVGLLGGGLVSSVGGWFTVRATARATAATDEAQRAVARIAAEPARDQVHLSILKETTDRLDREGTQTRDELHGLRILVRALGRAYEGLYRWAATPVGPPPEPEERVKEYLRTGV